MSIRLKYLVRAIRGSLKLEILAAVLCCLFLSLGCFFGLRFAINQVLRYSYTDEAERFKLEGLRDDFQRYITENRLSSENIPLWESWVRRNDVIALPLNKRVEALVEARGKASIVGIRRHPLDDVVLKMESPIRYYPEGEVVTIFVYVPGRSLRIVSWVLSLLFSFMAFVLLFYGFLKKKMNYILKIDKGIFVLESGDLDYSVPIEGRDELARLAGTINAVSQSIKSRILSEQKALQANKEIIGDLSHDIRTPLTVGIGYLTLLLENEDLSREERRNYLTLALKKTHQIKERTEELLDFATIYSGQQQVNRTPLNFKVLAEQLMQELSALTEVRLRDELPDDATICGDIGLLERVFDNLLSNVQKYGDMEKLVELNCFMRSGNACIEIVNFVNGRAQADGKSLGLKISAYILEVHDGFFETSEDGDIFRTRIAIPVL